MEPAFHRGDILFLHMGYAPFRAGDIVVFKVGRTEADGGGGAAAW
jgi:signal peptidase I